MKAETNYKYPKAYLRVIGLSQSNTQTIHASDAWKQKQIINTLSKVCLRLTEQHQSHSHIRCIKTETNY